MSPVLPLFLSGRLSFNRGMMDDCDDNMIVMMTILMVMLLIKAVTTTIYVNNNINHDTVNTAKTRKKSNKIHSHF